MMYIELTPFEENLQYIINHNAPSSEASIQAHEEATIGTTPRSRLPAFFGGVTEAHSKGKKPNQQLFNHTAKEADEEEECYELLDVVDEEKTLEEEEVRLPAQIAQPQQNREAPAGSINSNDDDIVIEIEEGGEENSYLIKCTQQKKKKQTEGCSCNCNCHSQKKLPQRLLNSGPIRPAKRSRRPVPAAIPISSYWQQNGAIRKRRDSRESASSSLFASKVNGIHLNGYHSEAEEHSESSECESEPQSQMGMNIVAKLRRLLNLNSDSTHGETQQQQQPEPQRKRKSEYWESDVNPIKIKYRNVHNRFPKVITHTLDDDDVEMISTFPKRDHSVLLNNPLYSSRQMSQRKARHPMDKPKPRKSMFNPPSVTHSLVRNTSYADVEFSDDDEAELVQGFNLGASQQGARKPKVYNIPIQRVNDDCVSFAGKPPPPLIEARTGSILATSLMPGIEGQRKPLTMAESFRDNLTGGLYGNQLGRRSGSSGSTSAASTSASLIGGNGLSNLRSKLWSTNARSILNQVKENEEHEKYQQLLEQVVPCLYAADAGNTRQALGNNFKGIQRRSALAGLNALASSPRLTVRKPLNPNSSLTQLKPPLSSTINLVDDDDDEDDEVTFTGVLPMKEKRGAKHSTATTVVIDDDDDENDDISEIVDLREDEQQVVSACSKIQRDSAAANAKPARKTTELRLPYVEPVNSLEERFKTSPHLRSNWLETQHTKWNQKRKNLEQEVKEASNVIEKLTAERRAAELEMHERLRQIQIVDHELLVLDDFPEPCVEEEPEFVELTADHQARIKAAIYGPPDEVLVSKFNLNITRRDIHTLLGHNWLNDEVINFYMNLLTERGDKKHDSHGLPRVYAMNTFFVPRLLSAGHSGVKRWTRKVDIFAKDIIPVPVHVGGVHWCMAIIHLKNRTIKYYDSMGTPNPNVLKALEQYLKDESTDKRKQPFDTSQFEIESVRDVPRQMNGSDCGVFSCMFAEYITRNKDITFSQQHMEYFRHKMILEIVQGELLQ